MNFFPENKFHTYKIRLVQELSVHDFDRSEEFADIIMEKYFKSYFVL